MSRYLYKLIEQGEHEQQDFKFCINDSKKIAKSLVAFANTNGGRLLIGVKDNGKIAGISSDEEFYMIESAAKIFSKPAITFTTRQWQVEGKTVLEIGIEPGSEKPYFAKDENGKWLAYIRIGDENFLAHRIQIEAWKKQSSPNGVCFSYSDDERLLIEYLQNNDSISFSKYMRLAQLSRKKAGDILSNFVVIDVLKIKTSNEGTTFTLNHDVDKSELDKFR
ncbi:RNA-binding domain-containing protein [Maribellus sp. YY47]|uniref:AlbA family DNA-binding domain-containing protein n=1 Tax=Maribellus sp. YY47 TaxID=2929486 RepID=UPI002000CC1C|nr:RNA-binding domain-containing protein [Maribellus sp. YY47]MCK3685902.1 putative DNA binding domain-containing protein [Maribellus sp. YY47]